MVILNDSLGLQYIKFIKRFHTAFANYAKRCMEYGCLIIKAFADVF